MFGFFPFFSMDTNVNAIFMQPITFFIQYANALYGSITTIHKNGWIVKNIPWPTFLLSDKD